MTTSPPDTPAPTASTSPGPATQTSSDQTTDTEPTTAGRVRPSRRERAARTTTGTRYRRISPARRALPWVTTIALIACWQLAASTGVLPTSIPGPTAIAGWLVTGVQLPTFWTAIAATLLHTIAGVLLGSVVGVGFGVLLGEIPIIRRLLSVMMELLRAIPVLVYLPLVILLWGNSDQTATVLVAVAVFWPMTFQTLYGLVAVDPQLVDSTRMFGISRAQRLRHVTAPSLAPYLATGLRIATAIALIVAVSVELISGVPGLGWQLTQFQTAANYPAVYAIVVVTGLLSLLLNQLMVTCEKKLLSWHVSVRGVTS